MNETPENQPQPRSLTRSEHLQAIEQAAQISEVMDRYLKAVEDKPQSTASFQNEVAKTLNKLGETESAMKFALLAANTENTSDQKRVVEHLNTVMNQMRSAFSMIEGAALKMERSSKNMQEAADRNDLASRRNARG